MLSLSLIRAQGVEEPFGQARVFENQAEKRQAAARIGMAGDFQQRRADRGIGTKTFGPADRLASYRRLATVAGLPPRARTPATFGLPGLEH